MTPLFQNHFPNVALTPRTSSLAVGYENDFFPSQCSICPEQFMRKKTLTLHMMKAHGHPKPHAVSLLLSWITSPLWVC